MDYPILLRSIAVEYLPDNTLAKLPFFQACDNCIKLYLGVPLNERIYDIIDLGHKTGRFKERVCSLFSLALHTILLNDCWLEVTPCFHKIDHPIRLFEAECWVLFLKGFNLKVVDRVVYPPIRYPGVPQMHFGKLQTEYAHLSNLRKQLSTSKCE